MARSARFTLENHFVETSTFADDVRRGLTRSPKSLPPHHFYDELGSALFDAITRLPEYYVTRAETGILATFGASIAEGFGTPVRLVELGAGSSRKTRLLFDAILKRQAELEYIPVDVDPSVLERAGRDLLDEYPQLRIDAVCTDFRAPSVALETLLNRRARNVVVFLGSTIGNLDFDESVAMFEDLRRVLGRDDALFLGADLKKSKQVVEPAYDDALGVTAAFNLNLLVRINRELGGHFDVKLFAHRAFFNEDCSRIEMHLVARENHVVPIDSLGIEVAFRSGETIHTENSYKYEMSSIDAIAAAAGFRVEKTWTDPPRWFADFLLRPSV